MRNLTRIVGSNGATRKTVIAMKDEADGRNQLWKDADLRHAEVGRPDTMSDETFGFEVRVMRYYCEIKCRYQTGQRKFWNIFQVNLI